MKKALKILSTRKRFVLLGCVLLGLGGLALLVSSRNASATGGVFHVSPTACSDSGPGTEAEPFCWLQEAITAASQGDTIIVHGGTYSYTADQCAGNVECLSMIGNYGCGYHIDAAAVVTKPGLHITVPDGEVAVLELNRQLEVGIWIGAADVEVRDIHVNGQRPSGDEWPEGGQRLGGIQVGNCDQMTFDDNCHGINTFVGCPAGSIANVIIDGVDVDVTYGDRFELNSTVMGILVNDADDNLIIRNNVVRGKFHGGIWLQDGLNGAAGAAIDNNLILPNGDSTVPRHIGMFVEALGIPGSTGVLNIFNNVIDFSQATAPSHMGMYIRDNYARINVFNNRLYDTSYSALWLQTDTRGGWSQDIIENLYVFNNYFSGAGVGVNLYNCYNVWMRNNIFQGYSIGVDNEAGTACPVDDTTPATGDISYNFCEGVGTCVDVDEPGIMQSSNEDFGDLNILSDGHLQPGSAAIDAGMNDPVEQGANTCSFTGTTTPVDVNCLLDIDGDVRPQGIGWDIGADEYQSDAPVNNPPVLASIGSKSTNENQLLTFTVSATDADPGDTLTFSMSNNPSGSNLTNNGDRTATFTWTPSYTQAEIFDDVQFSVTDGTDTDAETITITVNNMNRSVILTPIGNKTLNEGDAFSFIVTAIDSDLDDTVDLSATNLPLGSTFIDNGNRTGTFNWTPTTSQADVYPDVHFEVTDGTNTDFEDITITVLDGLASCTPNWTCTDWSVCSDSLQTRTCTDQNSCGTDTGRPTESQACDSEAPGRIEDLEVG